MIRNAIEKGNLVVTLIADRFVPDEVAGEEEKRSKNDGHATQ